LKYVDEYRKSDLVNAVAREIKQTVTTQWNLMEVCGGQTHTIMKYGLEELLPEKIKLIHGPGCPVCVTSVGLIDKAVQLAAMDDVVVATYGDMLRVPGSEKDLLTLKAEGADVRIIYSSLDALKIAENEKDKKIIFFAVGFETTAPATAYAIIEADRRNISNFFILNAHVLIPPAIEMLLSTGKTKLNGLIAPGHVCTVTGYEDYLSLSDKYKIPIAVTGFEPLDILNGIFALIKMLEANKCDVENRYARSVKREGNTNARKILEDVFDIVDRDWRGIGVINRSGYKIKQKFSRFDAEAVFNLSSSIEEDKTECIAGEILQGLKNPQACEMFGIKCTPENPVGAPMVSSEGACAAYYKYKKNN
jgi:hydrogenase expression/formation protein HypD